MDDKARIRLECLRLAEKAQTVGDSRPLMDIAREYYEWVLGAGQGKSARKFVPGDDAPLFSVAVQRARPRTIKDMVIALLREYEPKGGLTALEILDGIQKRWYPALTRTSLSPQLSRLKKYDHRVMNEKGVYKLRKADASPENSDEAP